MVQARATLHLSDNEYVSHVVALPNYLVAALTDGSIHTVPISGMRESLVNRELAKSLAAPTQNTIAGLAALPATPMATVSCTSDGSLTLWDLRAKNAAQQNIKLDQTITALGVSSFGEVAVGCEASPDAEISIFDVRQIKAAKPLVKYRDSHNDDITDLQFHPTIKNRMVSGSTDGIVNLFDISVHDEDEAVLEAYNHQASIHRAGFFTDTQEAIRRLKVDDTPTRDRVFALSHMETLTIYNADLSGAEPSTSEEQAGDEPIEFGDVREAWKCQYVADYQKQHFLVGSNDDKWASLVPILDATPQPQILLEGGHGEEVVRCFDIWQQSHACFTGGEDGTLKAWDLSGSFDESARLVSELAEEESNKNSAGKSAKRHAKRSDPIGHRPDHHHHKKSSTKKSSSG